MTRIAILIIACLIPFTVMAESVRTQSATDSATSWLVLIDANKYPASWDAAGDLLKTHIPEAQWEIAAKAARGLLGAVAKRTLVSLNFATALTGAPTGQYATVQFKTDFVNKVDATETVALTMDHGTWKAVGYYVK